MTHPSNHLPPAVRVWEIVHKHYRGNYTSYERDVRLATAVKDKYTQPGPTRNGSPDFPSGGPLP